MDGLIEKAVAFVKRKLAGDSSGHDWWHIERVWRLSNRLAEREGADRLVVQLAALLHDVGDWKFHAGDETAGRRLAAAWLEENGVESQLSEAVCLIIDEISFKGAGVATPMSTLEGRVVQDADRLDALGAIGTARAFAYGGSRNRVMHDPREKPHLHQSFEAYKNSRGTTVNHFHEKLLLLRERMNTSAGRALAESRHRFMEQFLARFETEWQASDLDGDESV